MNIREIEETIHTLETRHPGLNEVMLLTLLKAGGWEDKDVETAKLLFRSTPTAWAGKNQSTKTESLPATQEAPLFEPASDEAHRIEAPHEEKEDKLNGGVLSAPEPVSLIQHEEKTQTAPFKEDLPHNLPLRPFETSEHIWPFSRYKDVFFGEEQIPVPSSEIKEVSQQSAPLSQSVVTPTQVEINSNHPPQKTDTVIPAAPYPQSAPLPPISPVKVSEIEKKIVIVERTGDEKLVVMASMMLLTILLLLGYMYSNGRL